MQKTKIYLTSLKHITEDEEPLISLYFVAKIGAAFYWDMSKQNWKHSV